MAIKYGGERDIKKYYSISEVCSISGLEASTVRYWEEKFPQLNPPRNRAGNRTYALQDFQLVQYIKFLVYTRNLEDDEIRNLLNQTKKSKLEDMLKSITYGAESPMQTQLEFEQKSTSPLLKNKLKELLVTLRG
ncbi:MAG: MerR family transcriptional regulator [Fibrobacterales bacterium]